ncbi:MAG: tryptophan 7-halogenase [Zoogloeaceae bacterium]|jgi:flavin-dependent dehydrogenase|nr:tryptophan 7-halogenase [Zoogloeaceae bacterium]
MRSESLETIIIGAGPAGAVAAGLLRRAGRSVTVLEKAQFPRFVIGESLLPQSMAYLEAAGMLQDVIEAGFQFKNGAAFACDQKRASFDFRRKFTPGWGTTCQVPRAPFDKLLADAAARQGADIRYGHEVTALSFSDGKPELRVAAPEGEYRISGVFVLDASGYGRVLPRLLGLEIPSALPARQAIFTHIEDRIAEDPAAIAFDAFEREKILISVHPQESDIWYWLIPFSNGRSSLGVVGRRAQFDQNPNEEDQAQLRRRVAEAPNLARLLRNAVWDTPVRRVTDYSANVKTLAGAGFALLGNAGEFLDPVFSSGVTIAFKSADLAVSTLLRQLAGEAVDWQRDYAAPLMQGVETFRAFVNAWYDGKLQDIIFYPEKQPDVECMISSVLAGYAWDTDNPFVARPVRKLDALAQAIRAETASAE